MSAAGLSAILASVALVVCGQLLLKQGMTRIGPVDPRALVRLDLFVPRVVRVWQLVLGFTLYAGASAIWVYALSLVPLARAYPFLSFSYVAVPLAAAALLGERPTPAQWLGVLFIVAGVIMVALGV